MYKILGPSKLEKKNYLFHLKRLLIIPPPIFFSLLSEHYMKEEKKRRKVERPIRKL